MLAAKSTPKARHYHPYLIIVQAKSAGEFPVIAKRILCASPDREFTFTPLGQRRTRFQGSMLHIRYMIRTTQ